MEVKRNSLPVLTQTCVHSNAEGREFCVLVAKATFDILPNGTTRLADEQLPFVFADEHHDAPGLSSLKYESEFAPWKPRADVLLVGEACAPAGQRVQSMLVGLVAGQVRKAIRVTGNRVWKRGIARITSTQPEPFIRMPLLYERAFGGSDHTHNNPAQHATYEENPVGVGFHKNANAAVLDGTPLPNLEDPRTPVDSPRGLYTPKAYTPVGRSWMPRRAFAGTYDEQWMNQQFPFLPLDFDDRYFQSTPADQQTHHLQGGEEILCTGMRPDGQLRCAVPRLRVDTLALYKDHEVAQQAVCDTLILEPNVPRLSLLWRTAFPLTRRVADLREIIVGDKPAQPPIAANKPTFRSLSEVSAWRKAGMPRKK